MVVRPSLFCFNLSALANTTNCCQTRGSVAAVSLLGVSPVPRPLLPAEAPTTEMRLGGVDVAQHTVQAVAAVALGVTAVTATFTG